MNGFATLLTGLALAQTRPAKLRALEGYLRATPDPDRGWALAALMGDAGVARLTPAALRAMAEARVDPVLLRLSHDFVGDLAETVALIWPERSAGAPPLAEVIADLRAQGGAPAVAGWLYRMGVEERLALMSICAGPSRAAVTPALARQALAKLGGVDPAAIAALWHGLAPPYADLFRWLDGGEAPSVDPALAFRPMAAARGVEDPAALLPADFAALALEEGVRVQAVAAPAGARLFNMDGEDIGAAFPDLLAAMTWRGCVEGVLTVMHGDRIAPASDLRARLARARPAKRLMTDLPAAILVCDLLHDGARDLRALPWLARRAALARWLADAPARLHPAPELPWHGPAALPALSVLRAQGAGVTLMRRDAPYGGGGRLDWPRAPRTALCVLSYAQRGVGARASYYADLTFGVLGPDGAPVPIGKAPAPEAELARIDDWVRGHLTERFGPVRGVAPGLVLEVAFDALVPSARRKSGVAAQGARITRVRWDLTPEDADGLAALLGGI
jgi:DNA ligase-1